MKSELNKALIFKGLSFLLCGVLFGLGLAASGMTNTAKVIGFLDIFSLSGAWDVDLLLVMASAVMVSIVGLKLTLKKEKPLLEDKFNLPTLKHIDKRLILGAVLFGIGWGFYGYCPGPAIAALAYLSPVTIVFVVSMVVGMFTANKMFK